MPEDQLDSLLNNCDEDSDVVAADNKVDWKVGDRFSTEIEDEFYQGIITEISNENKTCSVKFDDGDVASSVDFSDLFVLDDNVEGCHCRNGDKETVDEEVVDEEVVDEDDSETRFYTVSEDSEIVDANMSNLRIHPNNPRQNIPDDSDIKSMVKAIKATGGKILTPLHITKDGGILSGRRRFYAYLAMKKTSIPAIVFEDNQKYNTTVHALIDQDSVIALTPVEFANAIKFAIDNGDFLDQSDAAKKLGKSNSVISRSLALLSGSTELLEAVSLNQISSRAALKVAELPEDEQILVLKTAKTLESKPTIDAVSKIINKVKQPTNSNTTKTKSQGRKKVKESVDKGSLPPNVWVDVHKLDPEKHDGDQYKVLITVGFNIESGKLDLENFDLENELKCITDDLIDGVIKMQTGIETARKTLDH